MSDIDKQGMTAIDPKDIPFDYSIESIRKVEPQLADWIEREMREARIDELEIVKIFNKNDDAALYAVNNRIKQLRKDSDE